MPLVFFLTEDTGVGIAARPKLPSSIARNCPDYAVGLIGMDLLPSAAKGHRRALESLNDLNGPRRYAL